MRYWQEFDFDLMVRLAKENPAEFARKREELLLGAIASFSRPDEGRRAQFEIDMERMRTPPGEQTYAAMAGKLNLLLREMADVFASLKSVIAEAEHYGRRELASKQP